jgi:hypothetical protein
LSAPDPIAVALRVAEILESLGVNYVLGGSLASTLHGEPRATMDVDMAVDLRLDQVEAFHSRLGEEFYAEIQSMRAAVREERSFNLIHLPSMMKVDIFIPPREGIHTEKWKRRQRLVLQRDPERSAWVTDPENIVLQKLEWFRQGGGVAGSQWRDVLGVLKVQSERLDLDYIRLWAGRMEITELLEKALRESGSASRDLPD